MPNENDDPVSNSIAQKIMNALVMQLTASMQFGGGQDPSFSLSPGVMSQSMYENNYSDNDPMGQSYYGQDQVPSGGKMTIGSYQVPIIDMLKKMRMDTQNKAGLY